MRRWGYSTMCPPLSTKQAGSSTGERDDRHIYSAHTKRPGHARSLFTVSRPRWVACCGRSSGIFARCCVLMTTKGLGESEHPYWWWLGRIADFLQIFGTLKGAVTATAMTTVFGYFTRMPWYWIVIGSPIVMLALIAAPAFLNLLLVKHQKIVKHDQLSAAIREQTEQEGRDIDAMAQGMNDYKRRWAAGEFALKP